MRFLVDENLPLEIVHYLQSLRHDVFDVAASDLRGSSDKVLWSKAAAEKRIIYHQRPRLPYAEAEAVAFCGDTDSRSVQL